MRILSAFLFLFASQAQAEYRMFLLEIKSPDGSIRQVRSTLDPDQYPGYYPLHPGESITYRDTWKCKGRTNDEPACKSPRELAAEGIPTSAPPP